MNTNLELWCIETPTRDEVAHSSSDEIPRKDWLNASVDKHVLNHESVLSRMLNTEVRYLSPSSESVYKHVQRDIKPHMRQILTTWMMEVSEELGCDSCVMPLAVNYVDRFLACTPVTKNQLQLLGAVAMLVASKLRQCNSIHPEALVFYSDYTMTVSDITRAEQLFEFLKTQDDFVRLLLKHIETSAISDLFVKFLTGVDNVNVRNSIVKWLSAQGLVTKLIGFFKSDYTCDQQVNAAQLLCDMIKVSRENQSLLQEKADSDPLLEELESYVNVRKAHILMLIVRSNCVSELLDNMFSARTECVLVNGINILQSLLEYKKHCANIQQPIGQQQMLQPPNSAEFEGVPQCLATPLFNRADSAPEQVSAIDAERLTRGVLQVQSAVIPRLSDFHSLLLDPPEKASIRTTVGTLTKPLGASRLEIVHLIRALLSSNNPEVNRKLTELKTMNVIIDLFFNYPWKNFLHTQVEQSFRSIFSNIKSTSPVTSPVPIDPSLPDSIAKESAAQLATSVMEDNQLVSRLLDAWQLAETANKEKKPRPGYMGHAVKMANIIVDNSNEEVVKQTFENFPEEVSSNWSSFVSDVLTELNKRMQTPLVNEVPSQSFEDATRQENALQHAFIEYQMQQMTKNLCNQIGFNTSEFTELESAPIQPQVDQLTKINFSLNSSNEAKKCSLFDQVVSPDKQKSSDSNSSDEEDFWEDKDSAEKHIFDAQRFKNEKDEDMEVDNPDPWAGSSAPTIASNEVDPWGAREATTTEPVTKADDSEWADFTSFETSFGDENSVSTDNSRCPPNTCIAPLSSEVQPSADKGVVESEGVMESESLEVSETESSLVQSKNSELSQQHEGKDEVVS